MSIKNEYTWGVKIYSLFIKMFGIGLAKSIIEDNKKYPKRVGILGIVILIIGLIFILNWLFNLGGIFEYIGLIILLFAGIMAFYLIAD